MQRSAATADLRWDDVRLFLALSRAHTVGQAAEALAVDASTVSRRLVVLEEALGATLFDRGRGGISPTKAAEDLMVVAEDIEAVMTRFTMTAEGLEREASGLVRLTCPPDVAAVVVVPLVPELVKRHPRLRIEIQPGEGVVDLTRREADIALRTAKPSRGDLIVTRLTTARWIAVAAPPLARSLGALRSWSDASWVGWGERMAFLGAARWLTKHGRDIEPVVRSDSLVVQLASVANGVGIALVPEPSVQHYGLVPVKLAKALLPAAEEWPVDELYLVTHRALRDVPRVRVVWELLRQRLGEASGDATARRSSSSERRA